MAIMMNKGFFFLFLMTTISCGYKVLDTPGLKGRVKRVTAYKLKVNKEKQYNDTVFVSTSKYNKKGKVFEYLEDDPITASNPDYKGVFVYDKNNNRIKEIGVSEGVDIVVDYVYQDTVLLRLFSKTELDSSDVQIELNEQYYYDRNNQLTTVVNTTVSLEKEKVDTISYFVSKYDSNEKLVEQTFSSYGQFYSLEKFQYNDFGLQEKVLVFNEMDSLIRTDVYKYKFDEKGSWIEKEQYENELLKYIVKRTIDYG